MVLQRWEPEHRTHVSPCASKKTAQTLRELNLQNGLGANGRSPPEVTPGPAGPAAGKCHSKCHCLPVQAVANY